MLVPQQEYSVRIDNYLAHRPERKKEKKKKGKKGKKRRSTELCESFPYVTIFSMHSQSTRRNISGASVREVHILCGPAGNRYPGSFRADDFHDFSVEPPTEVRGQAARLSAPAYIEQNDGLALPNFERTFGY